MRRCCKYDDDDASVEIVDNGCGGDCKDDNDDDSVEFVDNGCGGDCKDDEDDNGDGIGGDVVG